MAGESTTARRAELADRIKGIDGADSKNDLMSEIKKALAVPAPFGDPGAIESAGKSYRAAADACAHEVQPRVQKVAQETLPDAWTGTTAVKAADVVAAADRAAQQMAEAFSKAGGELIRLADAVRSAQETDRRGRPSLEEALSLLGGEDGFFDDMWEDDGEEDAKNRAKSLAQTGVADLHRAAVTADDAGREAARELNKYAAEARSGKVTAQGLTAADKLMLADTSTVDENDPAREQNEILTSNDLQRSSQYLNKMNARDRAEFERMLAESKSPEERAYLMKALAAGNGLDSVRGFRDKIHPHGDDEAWLAAHLTPVVTQGDSKNDEGLNADGSNVNRDTAAFNGQAWAQGGDGQEGTCVASSTVTARAMVDPVYALGLTGGESGQENDPKAFRERLVDEQHRVHEEGDGGHEGWFGTGAPSGMDNDGKTEVVNKEISPHTGGEYELRETGSADARRDALPDIEEAVAEGKPVPIGVEGYKDGDRSGHAMMIVGQEGDMLQVYNPWGTTTWVSEDDFVNGRMQKASDNDLPDAYAVHVPK